MKSVTGVPQNEKWFFWALLVFIILAIGPGLQLASIPEFIGPFPILFVQELIAWVFSMILCYIAGYKLTCTQTDAYEEEILAIERKAQAEEEAAYAKGGQ